MVGGTGGVEQATLSRRRKKEYFPSFSSSWLRSVRPLSLRLPPRLWPAYVHLPRISARAKGDPS